MKPDTRHKLNTWTAHFTINVLEIEKQETVDRLKKCES